MNNETQERKSLLQYIGFIVAVVGGIALAPKAGSSAFIIGLVSAAFIESDTMKGERIFITTFIISFVVVWGLFYGNMFGA